MPFMSSPLIYPVSSSPTTSGSPAKKRKRSLKQDHGLQTRTGYPPNRTVYDRTDGQSCNLITSLETREVCRPLGQENDVHNVVKVANASGSDQIDAPLLGESILGRRAGKVTTTTDHKRHTETECGGVQMCDTSGRVLKLRTRAKTAHSSYEQIIGARSVTVPGKALRNFYGIEINALLEQAAHEPEQPHPVTQAGANPETNKINSPATKQRPWTEKYRARKFTDLIGDDRTHRSVMHWLKAWDTVVFPGTVKKTNPSKARQQQDVEPRPHRKILLLSGPPGLGKTTLAHVCAKQAGYEIAEINASDERSAAVVRTRIRDMLGTENVKAASKTSIGPGKVAKPLCLIVDEVDGVVTGSSGAGEGGFMKALIDLVVLDQKNSQPKQKIAGAQKRKGDDFRMLRPLIMICNDAYHPSLRPLRNSDHVEVIHCGRPALNPVANRVQNILEREGIAADADAVRQLCESCWGTTSKKEGGPGAGAGEGDIRSILVMCESIASQIRSSAGLEKTRLTKNWLNSRMGDGNGHAPIRGLGRGGSKEIVDRVFTEGAGLPRPSTSTSTLTSHATLGGSVRSVNEAIKAASSSHLRTLVDGHGETDRIMTELFTTYPEQPFQDDTLLSKPNKGYEWLDFHDRISHAVFGSSEWELAQYLSSPVLAFHHLFATSATTQARHSTYRLSNYHANKRHDSTEESDIHPFLTSQSTWAAKERHNAHQELLHTLHDNLSHALTRAYPQPSQLAVEFVPYMLRMLSPNVNPVLITSSSGGSANKWDNKTVASVRKASERLLVDRSVKAMMATGCRFERHRVEQESARPGAGHGRSAGGWVYRMTPALDEFGVWETATAKGFGNDLGVGIRYGVRQVLTQECLAEERRVDGESRGRRGKTNAQDESPPEEPEKTIRKSKGLKRDFFGRAIAAATDGVATASEHAGKKNDAVNEKEGRIWVSYHEGYSNAVRKPVTLAELMRGM